MRIAFDARPLAGHGTGINRYVQCLLEAMVECQDVGEIWLWSPRGIKSTTVLDNDPRVRRIVTRGWRGNLWLQVIVPVLLERYKVDVFHATLFLCPVLARRPCVVNIYDLTPYRYPWTMERGNRWLLQALLPRAVSKARKILAPSAFTKQEIRKRWPQAAEKVEIVPGAPFLHASGAPGRVHPEEGKRILASYRIRPPYVLSVGTLEPRKNLTRTVEAFGKVHRMGATDLQLVLAGPSGWGTREVLRAMESSPARDAIRWLGYVPDEDLRVLYEYAEVFVYLSLYEGFGFPPLEAMAAGTCVIASNRGSLPECLGEAAMLTDPLDTEQVALGILALHRDERMRAACVEKGLLHVQRYSWEKTARMVLSVYRELTCFPDEDLP